jgi:hypothetical protein
MFQSDSAAGTAYLSNVNYDAVGASLVTVVPYKTGAMDLSERLTIVDSDSGAPLRIERATGGSGHYLTISDATGATTAWVDEEGRYHSTTDTVTYYLSAEGAALENASLTSSVGANGIRRYTASFADATTATAAWDVLAMDYTTGSLSVVVRYYSPSTAEVTWQVAVCEYLSGSSENQSLSWNNLSTTPAGAGVLSVTSALVFNPGWTNGANAAVSIAVRRDPEDTNSDTARLYRVKASYPRYE